MSQAGSSNISGLNANVDTEVGKVVVDLGLASRSEVDFCKEQLKQSSDPSGRSLADLLIEHSFITVNQAKRIRHQLEEQRKTAGQLPGYVLISKVGKGAMATVYKARQVSLDRIVAVKVLPKRLSENPEFVERFYKEGKAAARLSHNNIVQAIDVATSPDQFHFFVMEFIEGDSLYDIMQPPPVGMGKRFTEAETLDVMIQIAEALAHAHERGLVHRDVKPKNIILTRSGVAKLTDLGLARAVDDKEAAESEAGKAYGTPYYISPEQIRGDVDIDFRADIYSFGATMYHLLTGRPPFEGETPSAVMHKHLKQPLVPPDHINSEVSAGTAEIVEFAMAKNRDERYRTTEDLLQDLKIVRSGKPPHHARRDVNLDALSKVEQGAQQVDMVPEPQQDQVIHSQPAANSTVILLAAVAGISILINIGLIVTLVLK